MNDTDSSHKEIFVEKELFQDLYGSRIDDYISEISHYHLTFYKTLL